RITTYGQCCLPTDARFRLALSCGRRGAVRDRRRERGPAPVSRRQARRPARPAAQAQEKIGGSDMPEATPARARKRRRIDVHQHIYPKQFTKRMLDALIEDSPDFPAAMYLDWSPEQALAMMETHAIDTVMVSLTSPGLWFGDAVAAREAAREFNEL